MYYPSKAEFTELSKKHDLVPVYREILADMETPVSAYAKISGVDSFLLESVEGGERLARYSFLGCDPMLTFKSRGNEIEIAEKGKKRTLKGDPIKELEKVFGSYNAAVIPSLPRFYGGFVGYAGYDVVRFIENLPTKQDDPLGIPDMYFMLADTVLAFDHVKRKILVISNAVINGDADTAYGSALKKIDELVKKIEAPLPASLAELEVHAEPKNLRIVSNMSKEDFCGMVDAARGHIVAGDIIQVVLSQRFETPLNADPFNVYRALRMINPSPYMFLLKLDGFTLVGSSPEVMVRLDKGTATVRPIAGTRPRGSDDAADESLAAELLADIKERAEHVMLVDLARNDLGRVCKYGSVAATELMTVEKYSHVMHIVSNVQGELAKGKNAFDLLRATFPAGTVSGAPKVRAMQIIDELETVKRGAYAGCVGYFSFSGDLDSCITIRTIIAKDRAAYVQAGAGIVYDSVPEREYQESVNKAKALMSAIAMTRK
jgi:anthranilate synthase component 1